VLGWKERVGVSLVVAAEAMAFLRADYLPDLDAFLIHRGVSDAKVIERTKTGDQHLSPVIAILSHISSKP
jgi:hypothetical protein